MSKVRPFKIQIPESDLEDLKTRLKLTRWPDKETVDDWSQGMKLAVTQDLAHYWATKYNWRDCETRLNGFDH